MLFRSGETNFYGNADICVALKEQFAHLGGWMRVMDGASESFWGAYTTSEDQEEVEEFLRLK